MTLTIPGEILETEKNSLLVILSKASIFDVDPALVRTIARVDRNIRKGSTFDFSKDMEILLFQTKGDQHKVFSDLRARMHALQSASQVSSVPETSDKILFQAGKTIVLDTLKDIQIKNIKHPKMINILKKVPLEFRIFQKDLATWVVSKKYPHWHALSNDVISLLADNKLLTEF